MLSRKTVFFLSLFLFFGVAVVQADFGNWFVANKRLASVLDSSDKKISYRFTCQDDMTLASAAVYCLEAVTSPAYLISLREDKNGLPSETILTSTSYVPHAQSWSTLSLESIPLLKGKVYHLVLEQDITRGGSHPVGVIGPKNHASFLSTDILNHMHPNDQSPDLQANTLLFENGKWKELNQEPVYAVYGTGSQFQGNPYDDPGVRPIYGKILQGQTLHFHCGCQVKALSFRVRKVGNPATPLNYIILSNNYHTHTCNTLYKKVALNPSEASSDFKWVTIGLPPEIASFPAECYYFVFQTDSGRESNNALGFEDGYALSDVGNSGGIAHAGDMTFDGGAHLSRATHSLDGGTPNGWIDEFERDANLGAIGPLCPTHPSGQSPALPTPVPLGSERRLDP